MIPCDPLIYPDWNIVGDLYHSLNTAESRHAVCKEKMDALINRIESEKNVAQ